MVAVGISGSHRFYACCSYVSYCVRLMRDRVKSHLFSFSSRLITLGFDSVRLEILHFIASPLLAHERQY